MKLGLYPTMPMREYLDIKAFSSGLAHRILSQSPLHAWTDSPWNPSRARDDSDAADIGTYAHAMLLEGEHSNLAIVEADDWRTKAAKEQRDAARAEGKLPILARKIGEVEKMVSVAKSFIGGCEIATIFDDGAAEQTIVFEDNGLLCKARPDWLNKERSIGLSYKTTPGSAAPDSWIRTQLPGYDMGIVFYERAINAALGIEDAAVITLVQEQKAPWSCCLIGLSPAWSALAKGKLNTAIATWAECLNADKFPGYPPRICWAEPPAYLMAQAQEMEEQNVFSV